MKKVLLVSMEAAFKNDVRTYGGGLGILVGDKLRASKDLGLPVNVLTFSYPKGYSKHKIEDGKLITVERPHNPRKYFKSEGDFELKTDFGKINYTLLKKDGLFLIDTEIAPRLYTESTPEDRLKKEIVLGKISADLFTKNNFDILHIEESHGVFGALELHKRFGKTVKEKIRFTTHTPLPHGHERWDSQKIKNFCNEFKGNGIINSSEILRHLAKKVNCVSKLHAESMKSLLHWDVDYVTNGVHISWMGADVRKFTEKFTGSLIEEPSRLSNSRIIPHIEIQEAKRLEKEKLVKLVNETAFKNKEFDDEAFTVSSARRFSPYKRTGLLLDQLNRLESYAGSRPLQLIYAGLAHRDDVEGQKMIEKIINAITTSKKVKIAFLPEYDMDSARTMLAGSDVWTAVPTEKDEACGTSWMKASMNGTIPLVTKFGSVPEFLIHNQNSKLLFEKMNASLSVEMAEKLKQLMDSYYIKPKEFYEMSKNSMMASSGMTARRMMKEYYSRIY